MKKGSSGIRLAHLAALSFAFFIAGQTLICFLIMLAAIFLEKDEWLGRQTLQGVLLCLTSQLLSWIILMLYRIIPTDWESSGTMIKLVDVLDIIFTVLLIVLALAAIVNVLLEKEANLPFLSKLAYMAYGRQPVVQGYEPMPESVHRPAASQPTAQPPLLQRSSAERTPPSSSSPSPSDTSGYQAHQPQKPLDTSLDKYTQPRR